MVLNDLVAHDFRCVGTTRAPIDTDPTGTHLNSSFQIATVVHHRMANMLLLCFLGP
jgi:hypothetical protein